MIQVSDAYKELVKSNIRPKCEPIIKVFGKDSDGNDIELVWQAKNIKDLKYKRGVDPLNRELPYTELTWTEIYTGKLNSQGYPEKYTNITQYMAVELYFVQDLGFYNSWKTIFNGGISWKDIFSQNTSWKQLKNKVSQETIKMPKMILKAKPTINKQTIVWEARDFLYFLNSPVLKDLNPGGFEDMPFFNPLVRVMEENKNVYYQNIEILDDFLGRTIEKMPFNSPNHRYLSKRCIADNILLKDFILNYSSLGNWILYFDNEGLLNFGDLTYLRTVRIFEKNEMFNVPKLQKIPDVSSYSFKSYYLEQDTSQNYVLPYSEIVYGSDTEDTKDDIYRYNFRKYGVVLPEYNDGEVIEHELTYAVRDGFFSGGGDIVVTPLYYNNYDNEINSGIAGEIFEENNTLNPYTSRDNQSIERFEMIKNYLNSSLFVIEFESFPDFSIEPLDGSLIFTNLFDEKGEIDRPAILVNFEINYNGAFKEKFVFHDATTLGKG